MRRRRSSRLAPLAKLLTLLALGGFLLGLLSFGTNLPRQPDAPGRQTDAIVVLTGGAGRIDRGFELLDKELSQRLFISGVYRGVEVGELLELAQRSPQELRCCIELGYEADNTIGNARETAAWARDNEVQSLRLVTAAYHMPRARLELSRRLPHVEILMEPVFSDGFREEDWLWRRHSAGLLALEYLKYLAAVVRGLPEQAVRLVVSGREGA